MPERRPHVVLLPDARYGLLSADGRRLEPGERAEVEARLRAAGHGDDAVRAALDDADADTLNGRALGGPPDGMRRFCRALLILNRAHRSAPYAALLQGLRLPPPWASYARQVRAAGAAPDPGGPPPSVPLPPHRGPRGPLPAPEARACFRCGAVVHARRGAVITVVDAGRAALRVDLPPPAFGHWCWGPHLLCAPCAALLPPTYRQDRGQRAAEPGGDPDIRIF